MAAEVLDNMEKLVPGLAMVQCRRIGLQRRRGNFQMAEEMYQKCIDDADDNTSRSFYAVKYARYLSKVGSGRMFSIYKSLILSILCMLPRICLMNIEKYLT